MQIRRYFNNRANNKGNMKKAMYMNGKYRVIFRLNIFT
jgi:hypothetical protein